MSRLSPRTARPLMFLYLIFGYVLIFSLWWAYLLYSKNKLSFTEQVELNKMAYENIRDAQAAPFTGSQAFKKLQLKYQRQEKMIIMEGCFFIIIMIFGFFFVRRSLMKELELADRQRNFLMSITHELKSPLASIKLVQQTIQKRELAPDMRNKLVRNSLFDVERLEGLVENILLATKIENDTYGFLREEVNLSDLLEHVKERYDMVEKRNISISFSIEARQYITGDRNSLLSLLVNLLDNAIKYSDEGASINVLLYPKDDRVELEVADQGHGIPEAERKKIFDKFYRIGSEETRKTKGTGLGLYIVKNIVDYHYGVLSLSENKPKGTVFSISLPKRVVT